MTAPAFGTSEENNSERIKILILDTLYVKILSQIPGYQATYYFMIILILLQLVLLHVLIQH